jgi:histidinol phosphatase-like PHP family hydrolase
MSRCGLSAPWASTSRLEYRAAVLAALDRLSRSAVCIELNTSAWFKGLDEQVPANLDVEACRDRSIPITLSADAHDPSHLTREFGRAAALLANLGITPVFPLSATAVASDRHPSPEMNEHRV